MEFYSYLTFLFKNQKLQNSNTMCCSLGKIHHKTQTSKTFYQFYRNKQLRAHIMSEANEMKNSEASSLSQLIEETAPVCSKFKLLFV